MLAQGQCRQQGQNRAKGGQTQQVACKLGKAHHYFDLIRAGKTYAEIAASEGVSKPRVYKLVDLAFLAPDVVRDVFAGSQPTGLTTEWLLRHAIPALWDEQRETFRTL